MKPFHGRGAYSGSSLYSMGYMLTACLSKWEFINIWTMKHLFKNVNVTKVEANIVYDIIQLDVDKGAVW